MPLTVYSTLRRGRIALDPKWSARVFIQVELRGGLNPPQLEGGRALPENVTQVTACAFPATRAGK